jgi:hypothetical protein
MSGMLASARAARPAISFHTIFKDYWESIVAVEWGSECRWKQSFAL